MSDEPAPSEETDPTAPVPEAASAKPERRRKEPKPPKTPEEMLLAPSRSMQAWTTAFLLLSVVLLAAQVLRAADDFGNGPLGALLLAAVFAGLWVRSSRDYTVLKDFVRSPSSGSSAWNRLPGANLRRGAGSSVRAGSHSSRSPAPVPKRPFPSSASTKPSRGFANGTLPRWTSVQPPVPPPPNPPNPPPHQSHSRLPPSSKGVCPLKKCLHGRRRCGRLPSHGQDC